MTKSEISKSKGKENRVNIPLVLRTQTLQKTQVYLPPAMRDGRNRPRSDAKVYSVSREPFRQRQDCQNWRQLQGPQEKKTRTPSPKGDDKYWNRRYSLFSRFDEGVLLDRESWFSVTPEQLAKHHAQRLACDVIVDGFCGAGGNAIQFAKTCKKVIAIDMDPHKIQLAKHNAAIYGVAHKIQFIVGDFMELASTLKADMVFLSPPWGGPDYVKQDVFSLEKDLLPVSIHRLLETARAVSPNIAAFLPKNSNTDVLLQNYRTEVEANYVGKWQNAITVYWGKFVRGSRTTCHVPFL